MSNFTAVLNHHIHPMKKNVIFILAVLFLATLFTACEKEGNKVVNPIRETKTYTAKSGLTLTCNGETVVGKKVAFAPNPADAHKADITLEGDVFSVSEALSKATPTMGSYITASPIPGSATVTFSVDLTITGDQCTFGGNTESEYCTFAYNGIVSDGAITLNLSNVKLKRAQLAETSWKLTDFDNENYTTTPIVSQWKSADSISIEIFPGYSMKMAIGDVLTLAVRMPLIGMLDAQGDSVNTSVSEAIGEVLKNVSFTESGSIIATYRDSETQQLLTSPATIAQYVEPSGNRIQLILNPHQITETTLAHKKPSDPSSAQTSTVFKVMLPYILDLIPDAANLMQNGIPVQFERPDENRITFYLDETLLKPLLQATVLPLLDNEAIKKAISQKLENDPKFEAYSGMIKGVINSLPGVINHTTSMKLGLNFVKQ